MNALLTIDPRQRTLAHLVPYLAERIEDYAARHQPDVVASAFQVDLITRLWRGDPDVLVLAVVDQESAEIVGHAVAMRLGQLISVLQADVEDRKELLAPLKAWAESLGVPRIVVAALTEEDGQLWEDLGFTFYRHILYAPIDGPDPFVGRSLSARPATEAVPASRRGRPTTKRPRRPLRPVGRAQRAFVDSENT